MKRLDIKTRVTLWYTALMALLCAGVLLVLLLVGSSVVRESLHHRLMEHVDLAAEELTAADGAMLSDERCYSEGIWLLLYDDGYRFLAGRWPADFPDAVVAMDGAFRILRDGSGFYVYDRYVETGAGGRWLRGIAQEGSAVQAYTSLLWLLAAVLPLIVLLTGIGGWLIAKRAFAPVAALCEQAERISGGNDLSKRLPPEQGDDELHRLARTLDGMLARLEESFEKERRFTSDVAHELRTPTSVILAECELALEDPHTPEDTETLETIRRQAARMARMTEDMLALSRMDCGAAAFRPVETDIAELVTGVCREQQLLTPDLCLTCRPEPVTASVDRDMLARALSNLLANAVRYGGKSVQVRLQERNDRFTIAVSDDGIGISEEACAHIFDRFYREDRARTYNGDGGSGLGLSIVSEIVRLHGGTVTVDSTPGSGSTFTLELPLAAREESI